MERREPTRLLWLLQAAVLLGALLSRRPARRLPEGVQPEDVTEGYEHSDLRPGVVLAGLAGLGIVLVLLLVGVTLFEAEVVRTAPTIAIQQPSVALEAAPPAPRLEAQPGEDLQPYLAAERKKLTTYRWVDREAGVVAIPIEQAMDLVARQGLPTRAAPANLGNQAPSVSSSGRVDEAYP